jgi:dTDP-4-amino-4,6-dideoxygalactose transaminase
VIPKECGHNAHMYYILLNSLEERTKLMKKLSDSGIKSVFHYVPLHSSPAGKKFTKVSGAMENTDSLSDRLLRLPMWVGLGSENLNKVIEEISSECR